MTFKIQDLSQPIAAAWLEEAGESRPLLDILRSDAPLSPELREAMARWIERGAKRKRGAIVPKDPMKELPPSWKLYKSMNQRRAYFFFATAPTRFPALRLAALMPSRKRGRPRNLEGEVIALAVKKLSISERTLRTWFWRYFPNGYG